MLTERLMRLTIAGGSEWVMVLLLALSVISIAVIIERWLFFRGRRAHLDELDRKLGPLINKEETAQIKLALAGEKNPVLHAAIAGHDRSRKDTEASEKIVASALTRERLQLERRLTFLGTLGNNAPFIGLFGTVLGIIRAFNDLSLESGQANTSAVMGGISEALVATAIGLFVALPAVMAYNYFQKQVDRALSISESLAQGILAGLTPAAQLAEGGKQPGEGKQAGAAVAAKREA